MNPSLVAQFWFIAGVLALTPGADWAYAISAGLRARSGVPSVLGLLTGYALVVSVVAVGVGSVVSRYPFVLTLLTLAGAAYLVWLGLSRLVHRVASIDASGAPVAGSALGQLVRGAGVSGINPKGLLLLLALLPQFTSPTGLPSTVQMLLLGCIHLFNCAVVYFTVAHLARRLLRSRPRATVIVATLSGIAMIVIGALLLVERLAGGV